MHIGKYNMCTKPHGWNDTGTTNCTYLCGQAIPLPNQPTNLNIFLNSDNVTDFTNWSIVTGANGYNIYWDTNLTTLLRMNESNAPIPNAVTWGETSNLYNDTKASQDIRRFYRVSAFIWQNQNLTNVTQTVGKYSVTILSDGSLDEGTFSFPLNQTLDIAPLIPSPPNANAVVYTFLNSTQSWGYDYWTGTRWNRDNGFNYINFSEGYWTFGFQAERNMTNIGRVPFGTANKTILSGGVLDEGTFGWESITTGENITSVLPSPPNANAVVYTYLGSSFGGWVYDYWTGTRWNTDNGFLTFQPTYGYWTFGFQSEINMNYTRNPY